MHRHLHHPSDLAPSGGPDREGERRRLRIVLALMLAYAVAEIVGGLMTGSLALLADAGHMLTDVASLGLALGALWMSARPPTISHTYAYGRVEILVALVNGIFMWGVVAWIAIEAVQRLGRAVPVDAGPMLAVASGGLVVNAIAYVILHRDGGSAERSLNLRGAGLHVFGDLLGSVGAMTAAIVIRFTGWTRADPLASLAIGILILISSWRVVRDAVHVLLEGAPTGIDVGELIEALRRVEGVAGVHDLHVWTITSGYPALSAHVVCDHGQSRDMLLARLNRLLRERFAVTHTTIQLEPETPPDHARPMARPIPTLE